MALVLGIFHFQRVLGSIGPLGDITALDGCMLIQDIYDALLPLLHCDGVVACERCCKVLFENFNVYISEVMVLKLLSFVSQVREH